MSRRGRDEVLEAFCVRRIAPSPDLVGDLEVELAFLVVCRCDPPEGNGFSAPFEPGGAEIVEAELASATAHDPSVARGFEATAATTEERAALAARLRALHVYAARTPTEEREAAAEAFDRWMERQRRDAEREHEGNTFDTRRAWAEDRR